MPRGNQPVHKERIGFVNAAVWKNDSGFYSVTVSRSYKDGSDWKESDSFNGGDLLNAAKCLERCEAWIADQQQ